MEKPRSIHPARPAGVLGRLADAAVAGFGRGVYTLLAWIPHRYVMGAARRLADVCHAAGLRRRTLQWNLDLVFGDRLTPIEKQRIARSATRNLFLTLVETLRASHPRARDEILAQLEFEPRELWEELLRERRGLLFVVAHSGNFDLCGLRFVRDSGRDTCVVMKATKGHSFNAALVEGRERFGFEVKALGESGLLRTLIRRLDAGGVVCMLPDQHAKRAGVVTDFMGRPASTHRGPAFVALKARRPRLVVVVDTRVDDGPRHVCRLRELADYDPSGDTRRDVERLTHRFNDAMGALIERHPDSYLWHHRRWRKPKAQRRRRRVAASSEASAP